MFIYIIYFAIFSIYLSNNYFKIMPKAKKKIKKSSILHIFNIFKFSNSPIRSIIAMISLGFGLGIAYEETVGIGTWHSYHPPTDVFNVCFTPPSGCGGLIAQEISKAKSSIYVQAYGLTSKPIIYQLKAAKRRGVRVKILVDGGYLSNNKPVLEEFKNAGIEILADKMSGIAHNKVMIIDKRKVITGSFNFTKSADTRNAENVVLIKDKKIAIKYLQNWLNRKNVIKQKS